MQIILFAIIGAAINAGVAYWICYGIFCAWKIIKFVVQICSD